MERIERIITQQIALFTADSKGMGLKAKEYDDWCAQTRENTTEAFYDVIMYAKRDIEKYKSQFNK